MKHDEEDDIVNGWKAYFKKLSDSEVRRGNVNEESDDEGNDGQKGKRLVLKVLAEQYAVWCKPWLNSLIVKVLDTEILRHILQSRIERMWRPYGSMKFMLFNNGYYVVSFSCREDKDYAFQEGPWMIDDHYLLAQRWHPNFNPWKADVQRRVAVWIQIPDLPMEFYNVESFRQIGDMVGRTIKIDRSTSIYDKGAFAQLYVEVDLSQPLIPIFQSVRGRD